MSNDAAGFASATDRSVAPPNGAFDAGLRPGPCPDRAASLLPGLLAATRTGLPPAGDDELMLDQLIDQHLQRLGALRILCRRRFDYSNSYSGRGEGVTVSLQCRAGGRRSGS